MEINPRKVTPNAELGPVQVSRQALKPVEIEIGPVGCLACTSGDSPVWDFEQHILFGY